MKKVYGLIFGSNEKTNYYCANEEYNVGDFVIVNSKNGFQLAKVIQVLDSLGEDLEFIERLATSDEYQDYLDNLKDASKALGKCREYVQELGLDMHVVNATFNLDRTQLLFNFTADARVDFRELAKRLASVYHTRIELRQIGARDKAKEVGGIGICGGELCCLRFLNKMDTISMNMAKNQNLALNPSKINGSCGRLLCCLAYEDEVYLEYAKDLPNVGDLIKTEKGDAQVISVDIINRRGKVLLNGEKIDYEFKSKE